MPRFFTADPHFGHRRILQHCARSFASVDEMDRFLITNYNSLAGSGDQLWVLGDLALGDAELTLPTLALLQADLHLVGGNHDRVHPSNGGRATAWLERYRTLTGSQEIHATNLELELGDGSSVQLSHFPYPGVQYDPRFRDGDRYEPWRPADDGRWLLCGHVHEQWRQLGRVINVGVDAWGGSPVSEEQILALIAEGPANRDVLSWP